MNGLDIIIGPMFSGKTTELLRRLSIFSHMNFKVLCIGHSLDIRNTDNISTHSTYIDTKRIINCDKYKINSFNEFSHDVVEQYDIIGIDEAQFFGEDLIPFVLKYIDTKKIIISGLNGDANKKKFGYILDLIPHCNDITKLNSYCDLCKQYGKMELAIFSRSFDNKIDTQINIGGKNKYVAVCRNCYKL
jgi:thymidine kinase